MQLFDHLSPTSRLIRVNESVTIIKRLNRAKCTKREHKLWKNIKETIPLVPPHIDDCLLAVRSTVVSDFTKLLEELSHSSDRSLGPGSETNAKLTYKKPVRTSTDPYKR